MNIEESVEYLKNCLNDEYNFKNATRKKDKEAIETLLTAYEKEKEANKKLDKEAQGYLEELAGDGSMNIRRIQELEAELEKEKEKNNKARDMIEYYLIENNSLNDFDKRNKELKKLEKVLEE